MVQELTDMELTRVSLVDKGANGRRFAIFKRDSDAAGEPVTHGIIEKIAGAVAKALGLAEPVEKAMTFAQIVAGREMSDALEEHWTTLQDALWSAIYAYDEDGNPEPIEAKKALVGQNLDEFKSFLMERMDQGITKRDGPTSARLVEALVAKVGRKASAARVAQLKTAADALTAVLAEVAADATDESATTEKRATPQEETDVEKAELEEVLKTHLGPIAERLDKLEKSGDPEKPAEPVAKADGDGDGADDPVTLEGIAEAIGGLGDRIHKIETARGVRTSAAGEETVQKSDGKSAFAGMF